MGAVKEYYKKPNQEDDRVYDEWKKESLKLLSPKKSIAQRIRDYFKKGIKWIKY